MLGLRRVLRGYTWLLVAFTYLPIVVVAIFSFNDSRFIGEWRGFTLDWYRLLAEDARAWRALVNSLLVAVASSAASIAIASPAALWARGRPLRVADALTYPPIVIPEIAEAVSLLVMLVALGFPLGPVSVVVGHTAFNVAYAYLALAPVGEKGRRLAEAARTLGATPLQAFARITLPVALPGIVAAVALTFMMSFTDFTKTLFTTGPGFETLPLLVWNRARRPGLNPYTSHTALAALATVLITASLIVAAVVTWYVYSRPSRGGR